MLVLLLAIVLVFIVLLFEFRTLAAPLSILASAILSTSGVLLALLITRTDFNIASFMGLIMVIGIVAKNGILLLDADQKFRSAGYSAEESMIQAGRRRLRPILMTALAAIAGMLPLALALGAGSQMLQPLAIAVIGGIAISMVLSLIITPAVHYYLSHAELRPLTSSSVNRVWVEIQLHRFATEQRLGERNAAALCQGGKCAQSCQGNDDLGNWSAAGIGQRLLPA
jgi:multidrug efflux pump subunit AcrB